MCVLCVCYVLEHVENCLLLNSSEKSMETNPIHFKGTLALETNERNLSVYFVSFPAALQFIFIKISNNYVYLAGRGFLKFENRPVRPSGRVAHNTATSFYFSEEASRKLMSANRKAPLW